MKEDIKSTSAKTDIICNKGALTLVLPHMVIQLKSSSYLNHVSIPLLVRSGGFLAIDELKVSQHLSTNSKSVCRLTTYLFEMKYS